MTEKFTRDDVSRVAAILEKSSTWVDADEVFTDALAASILEKMTAIGYSPETVSPLDFRVTFGLMEYLDLIKEHILDDDVTEEDEVGDIYETAEGIEVVTPNGRWALTAENALGLVQGLAAILKDHLTRPASAEDDSSILSRGLELRRPVGQTAELAAIADHHA